VTFSSFKKLQTKLDQKVPDAKHWTREKLPDDRSVLTDIHTTTDGVHLGEGSVVQFSAWLMRRRPGSEESCNCLGSTKEATDIHVVLIDNSNRNDTPECESVTAEDLAALAARQVGFTHAAARAGAPVPVHRSADVRRGPPPVLGESVEGRAHGSEEGLKLGDSSGLRHRRVQKKEPAKLQG
jgi:hypothetical protein